MTKTPQTSLKTKNKKAILKEILYNGAISKTELAQKLNSTKTTVSKNANELINDNLLLEIGKGSNTIGKKSTLLDINPNLFHFIIINLSGNNFNLNIFNLKDEVLFCVTLQMPNKNDINSLLENYIIKYSSFKLISTISISVPGVVKNNFVVSNNKVYVDIYEKINNFCLHNNIKLLIHNNIDLQAEYMFSTKNVSNFILIGANFGIGSSIFYKGKLLKGSSNFAGEIGFTNPVLKNGVIENLEDRCSIRGIQKKMFDKKNIFLSQEEVIKAINNNDIFLNELIDNIINELTLLIVNMIYILDIKNIYLSGLLFELRNDIIQKICDNVLLHTKNEATIKYIPLHNKSIYGSILVVKREILKLV